MESTSVRTKWSSVRINLIRTDRLRALYKQPLETLIHNFAAHSRPYSCKAAARFPVSIPHNSITYNHHYTNKQLQVTLIQRVFSLDRFSRRLTYSLDLLTVYFRQVVRYNVVSKIIHILNKQQASSFKFVNLLLIKMIA